MKVPKPEILTLRPSRRLSRMIAKTASTTLPASFLGEPTRSWIKSMRSVLVMRIDPHLEGCCVDVHDPHESAQASRLCGMTASSECGQFFAPLCSGSDNLHKSNLFARLEER